MPDVTMVKLVRVGKKVEEFEVSDDATVGGLLKKAGLDYKPGCITINQDSVDERTEVEDGDVVYVGDTMKGNIPFTVKIIRLGHSDAIIELPCEPGTTIKNLIGQLPDGDRQKFYKSDGTDVYEYRINGGESVDGNTIIATPSEMANPVRLVMSTRTKGNE